MTAHFSFSKQSISGAYTQKERFPPIEQPGKMTCHCQNVTFPWSCESGYLAPTQCNHGWFCNLGHATLIIALFLSFFMDVSVLSILTFVDSQRLIAS